MTSRASGETSNACYGDWISVQRMTQWKTKGSIVIPSNDLAVRVAAGDKGESLQHNNRDMRADQMAAKGTQAGASNGGQDLLAKSTGSKFVHLEDMDGNDVVEMEVEGEMVAINGMVVNSDNCAVKFGGNGAISNKKAKKSVAQLDAMNLRVSHPSLAVGVKNRLGAIMSKHEDLKRRTKT